MDTNSKKFNWLRPFITTACVLALTVMFLSMMPYFSQTLEEHLGDPMGLYYGGFSGAYMTFLGVSSLLGAITAVPRRLGVGRGAWRSLPAEVLFFLAVWILSTDYPFCTTVAQCLDGTYAQDLQTLFSAQKSAQGIVDGYLFLASFAMLLVLYQGGAVLVAALLDGPTAYLKRSSLLVRAACWTLGKCGRAGHRITAGVRAAVRSMGEIDLTRPVDGTIFKLVVMNFLLVTLCCSFWFFGIGGAVVYSAALFFLLRRYLLKVQRQYQVLLEAAQRMANGDLATPVEGELGILNPLRDDMNRIREGFEKAVAEEVRSQNMKTELITNVSHDLKTPLTAIITYTDLLKDETLDSQTRREYVATLDKKSQRLKRLIEDLFEVSKAATGNVELRREPVELGSLLRQVQFELEDRTTASGVDFRWELPEEKVTMILDGQKTCRVLENLIVNITKYSLPGSRAYISLKAQEDEAVITMKNISATELDFDPQEITERFVRGDKSRNTEGSGLGLAIAKSFTELQGGRFAIFIDGDLFKVVLAFPRPTQAALLQAAQSGGVAADGPART